jgi:glyoxylase-like metal-dependent hydrolase (beta-lactamase superfamily II)
MQRILSALLSVTLLPYALSAHGDNSHFADQQEITIKVAKISGNVHLLQGRGGNIGALVGQEGILLVDDDYKVVSQKLSEALKQFGPATPKFILNTHWHGDHTEGNDFFGKQQSMIIAHANVRKRMMDPPVIFGRKTEPYASHALAMMTYSQTLTMYFNGEEVRLVHYPRGHTDGDTVVFFKNANVVHLGDNFFVGRFPFVDIDSGGSVNGLIHNVASIITATAPDAKLIPGHGPISTVDDLKSTINCWSKRRKSFRTR